MAPLVCSPDLAVRIAQTVRGGSFPEVAALLAGVEPKTFGQWMAKGAKGIEPFASFALTISRAEAAAEALATTQAMTQLKKSPAAAIAFLERRFGRRWSGTRKRSRSWMEAAFVGVAGGEVGSFVAKARGEQAPGTRARPRNGHLKLVAGKKSGAGRPRRGGTQPSPRIVGLPDPEPART